MGRGGDGDRRGSGVPGVTLAAAALLWAVGPAAPASGQATDGPRPGLELDGAAVLLMPLADLVPGGDGTDGGLQLSSSAGVRAAGIWWVSPGLGVGASGTWVPVDVDRLRSTDPDGNPISGGRLRGADYLAGSLEVVLSLPSLGVDVRVEPYLVGGAGVRRLSVEGEPEGAPSATDPMVAFGGGFRTLLSDRWLFRLEARDHASLYDGGGNRHTQHDLTVSVGVGVRP